MPYFVQILLRVLAGITGPLLLYVAFFLYEDEEARLQNRLDQVWRRIDELQVSMMSKEVAFLQAVTRTTSTILDLLFGHKLLSTQSIAVSMAFSMASFLAWWPLILTPEGTEDLWRFLPFYSLLLFFLGSLPALATTTWTVFRFLRPVTCSKPYHVALIGLVICYPAVVAPVLEHVAWPEDVMHALRTLEIVVPLGATVDVFFILFLRWFLRRIAKLLSFWAMVGCLAGTSAVTAILIGPAVAIIHLMPVLDMEVTPIVLVCALSMTNLVDAFCTFLLIMVMLTLLTHRLLWPVLKRPLYAANRKGLIKNTKLLGALGTMLLLYAFPNNPVVKWLTEFLPKVKG